MIDRIERQKIYAEEVIATAKAEGRRSEAKRLILNMLIHDLPLSLIAEISDQSEDSILEIAREHDLTLKND